MDFKKFASDAGTLFNRAKQYTEEKLGQVEKTELDAHFENLLQRAEKTREWTERLIAQTEAVLQPNPNVRMEEFLYEKIEKKKRDRLNNSETLGQFMNDAGNEFGPGTAYGSSLLKVGAAQQKLGQAEREFINSTANNFLQPLRAFLDGDMKTLQKEKKTLEIKRLDLDAAKNRLRRAKGPDSKDQGTVVQDDENVAKAEAELRKAQAEFDRQCEITKLLLEGISSTHAHHLRCLHDLVEAQTTYYAQCQQYMADLQRQLGSYSGGGMAAKSGALGGGNMSPDIHAPVLNAVPNLISSASSDNQSHQANGSQRATVLYDYDAADMSELSLKADEVIVVSRMPGDPDWFMGARGSQRGKIPATYINIVN